MRHSLRPAAIAFAFLLGLGPAACGGDDGDPTAGIDGAPSSGVDAGDVDPAPVVILSTTMGDLVVQLDQVHMPITTANFLGYVDSGFYDGTLVHRVIDDWVIQGGGYTTGLDPKTAGDPIPLETSPEVSHVHGAISMARTSEPDSATSQWFICDWPPTGNPPQPAQLDGEYAAFGVMIEGFDVLEAITQVSTTSHPPLDDVPVTEIVVTEARRR